MEKYAFNIVCSIIIPLKIALYGLIARLCYMGQILRSIHELISGKDLEQCHLTRDKSDNSIQMHDSG